MKLDFQAKMAEYECLSVWDVMMGQQKAKLDGHSNGILSVNFSPDGTTLASGSYDKSIRLWDLKISKEILQSDKAYKDVLDQFKILLQNSSLLPNVNPYCTILKIQQNPLFEASGTLILQGQFIIYQGIDLKIYLNPKEVAFRRLNAKVTLKFDKEHYNFNQFFIIF